MTTSHTTTARASRVVPVIPVFPIVMTAVVERYIILFLVIVIRNYRVRVGVLSLHRPIGNSIKCRIERAAAWG